MGKKLAKILTVIVAMALVIGAFSPATEAFAAYKVKIKVTDKKYGAKAGTDSTKAIQKALDDAAAKGTSKKPALVSIPAGTYYISKTLCIGSNTVLSLDKKTVIKKAKDAVLLYMLRSTSNSKTTLCDKGGYSDTKNITVKGGTWDAEFKKYNETSGGSLFFFVHTTNLKITDVTLKNNFGTHLLEMGGVKKAVISGCNFSGFKSAKGETTKEAVQIDVCHNDDILPAGSPFDDTPCENITVKNCSFSDYTRGVGSHSLVEGIYHKNIKITNNTFTDIVSTAVNGFNYIDVTVSGNTMTNVGSGVRLRSYSEVVKNTIFQRNSGVKAMSVPQGKYNLNVTGNTITTAKSDAADASDDGSMAISIYGMEKYPIKSVVISDNTVVSDSSGIYIKYSDDTSISNNKIDRHKGAYDVSTTKFKEDAIKIMYSDNVSVSGNTVSATTSDSFENGIAIYNNSSVNLSINSVNAPTENGLGVYSGSTCVSNGDTFTNVGKNGLSTTGGVSVTLDGTTFKKMGSSGLSLTNTTAVIKNCTVDDCASHGIIIKNSDDTSLKASSVNIDSTTFSNVSEVGLCVMSGVDVTMTDSTIDAAGNRAVQVAASKINIKNNVLKNSCTAYNEGKTKISVLFMNGANGVFESNTLSNPECAFEIYLKECTSMPYTIMNQKRSKAVWTTDGAGNRFE